jgi:hypothetical protein
MPAEAPLSAYVQEFDPRAYRAISNLSEPEYQEKKQSLDAYTTRQLQTLLGERYHVSLSTTTYELKDGRIYGQNMDEPALDSFIRGRDYRREVGSGIDFEREDAEIVGFSKVEKFLGDPSTPEGAMMLSISPKGKEGSSYQHNFYDIFTKKADTIEARRYTSALTTEEYSQRLGFEEVYDDAFLLAHPINVSGIFETPEEVHRFLHRDHEYMDEGTFRERILVEVAPFIANYIRACAEDGEVAQKLAFNSIINVADEVKRRLAMEEKGIQFERIKYSAGAVVEYGRREVEVVAGGCGNVEGFSFNNGALRVSDFDPMKQDQYGSLEVDCPACGATSTRPRGQLLERCANPGCRDPKAIACK